MLQGLCLNILSSMLHGLCLNTLSPPCFRGCAWILSLPCFRAVPEYSFFQTPWYFIISLFLPQVQLFQAVVSFLNTLINSRLRVNIYVQQVVGANLLWSVVCPLWCYHQYVTRCDVTINMWPVVMLPPTYGPLWCYNQHVACCDVTTSMWPLVMLPPTCGPLWCYHQHVTRCDVTINMWPVVMLPSTCDPLWCYHQHLYMWFLI